MAKNTTKTQETKSNGTKKVEEKKMTKKAVDKKKVEKKAVEKKSAPKKGAGKKTAPKKSEKKVEKKATPKKVEKKEVGMFPETLNLKGLGKYKKVDSTKISNYEDLVKFMEKSDDVILATHWTKREIQQFDYAGNFFVDAPKEFPNDLDILKFMAECGRINRLYFMSVYTDGMFRIDSEDVSGRSSDGMEFEFYTL